MIEIPAYRLAAASDLDLGIELVNALHKLRSGARMQTPSIDNLQLARQSLGERRRRAFSVGTGLGHLPSSTLLAMVMYLRPASRASTTA